MNDGCARISVGAVRAMIRTLDVAGVPPSCWQARIGGAKGLWMTGAVGDDGPSGEEDIWIEVSKSRGSLKSMVKTTVMTMMMTIPPAET